MKKQKKPMVTSTENPDGTIDVQVDMKQYNKYVAFSENLKKKYDAITEKHGENWSDTPEGMLEVIKETFGAFEESFGPKKRKKKG